MSLTCWPGSRAAVAGGHKAPADEEGLYAYLRDGVRRFVDFQVARGVMIPQRVTLSAGRDLVEWP